MAMMVPVNTVTDKPDRLQVNARDAGGDIQAVWPCRLMGCSAIGIGRTANQEVAAKSDADDALTPTPP